MKIVMADVKAGIGWGLAIALGLAALLLSGCQVTNGPEDGLRIGFMQAIHESENTQTTQVTLFGLEIAASSAGNGTPSVRLGYVRTQITSIPAYIPLRDADGTIYAEPTVSIVTEAGSEGRIRESFGVGKWGDPPSPKASADKADGANQEIGAPRNAAPYATGRGGDGAGPTTMTKPGVAAEDSASHIRGANDTEKPLGIEY